MNVIWITAQASPAKRIVQEAVDLEPHSEFGISPRYEMVDARRHPRFKLEVDIRVYPRDCAVVRGHTVDILSLIHI